MRQALTVLSLGLLLSCGNSLAPGTKEPLGTWAGNFNVLGSRLVLTLEQADGDVSGRGSYAFEAGRAGSLEVTGTYNRPGIALVLHYDFGQTLTYTGTFQDAQHLSGILADTGGIRAEPFTFTRR
jgi:hypothetical protein